MASSPSLTPSSITPSQMQTLINTQKASVGAPTLTTHTPLLQSIVNSVTTFWNNNINTPCKVLMGPAGNLLFHVPAPSGMMCTFPNLSPIGRRTTGPNGTFRNPDGTLVPATSTGTPASTARGGKRRATRNMRNMRNTRNKRSKRRATRHRR